MKQQERVAIYQSTSSTLILYSSGTRGRSSSSLQKNPDWFDKLDLLLNLCIMISVGVICTLFHIVNTPTCYLMRLIGSAIFNVALRPTKGCDKKRLQKASLILDLWAHV